MLETTLHTTFIPGSNVKGQVAAANWTFLLPSLHVDQLLCVGLPTAASMPTLARTGAAVSVLCLDAAEQRAAGERLGAYSHVVTLAPLGEALPLPSGSVGLVVIAHGANSRPWHIELTRVLARRGLVYYVGGDAGHRGAFPMSRQFWVTPALGEMKTAVSVDDASTIRYFFDHALYSPSVKVPLLRRTGRAINYMISKVVQRRSTFAGGMDAPLDGRPPAYLQTIARAAGVDIADCRWGLVAHGEYASRKVLFFLFEGHSDTPRYIVKMTREPRLNARLENEQRALVMLHQRGVATSHVVPAVAFGGQHAGLAIVGETIVDGVPFLARTSTTADCPYLHAATDWLQSLAVTTADRTAATPSQIADALRSLLTRFVDIYRPSADEAALLTTQIARIGDSQAPIPLVFQHGDPGAWNLMATPTGRTAFLDWEAFEAQGMPLWDLFYFMRSYAVAAGARSGIRKPLAAVERHLFRETPLSDYLTTAVQRYASACGLKSDLIEPLLLTCWMHRSLKEATRLGPRRLPHGHYVSLLRLTIAHRTRSPLMKMWA